MGVAIRPAMSQANRYVDTEHDCLKLNGTWARSSYELGQGVVMKACFVDMNPYGECKQAGGRSITNAPDEIRCQLPHSELGKMAQCREKHGLWAPRKRGFLCYLEAEEKKCREEGGSWEIGRMGEMFYCFKTAVDGGKLCSDNSECEFGCFYSGPLPVTENEIVGTCSTSNRSSGNCYVVVRHGKIDGPICP